MRFSLIAPLETGAEANQGWHFITAGIRYLLKRSYPGATFSYSDMMEWSEPDGDVLVLCGNPRYDLGDHRWMYAGLLRAMRATGKPIIDAWQGAAVPTGGDIDEDAEALLSNPRNLEIIELLQGCRVITRDALSQRVNDLAGLESEWMPCSSWWAAAEYGIEPRNGQTDAVVVYRMPGNGEVTETVRHLSKTHLIVATNRWDYEWCESIGVAAQPIYGAARLLRFYANCRQVITYRLHAAIPAASLGCAVSMLAIDSRAQACDAFGIPWADYREPVPQPVKATPPTEVRL